MRKEKHGFAAFDKESGKGLNVMFGMTTRTALTDDPEKVYLAQSCEQITMYTNWFNNMHKNKKEFVIGEVTLGIEVKPRWNKDRGSDPRLKFLLN